MAPAIIQNLFTRVPAAPTAPIDPVSLGPLAAHAALTARNIVRRADGGQRPDPSRGVVDPHNINNTAMFVLFGLIGAGFVILGIWFFFWAKNGGFYFKENDWEDYKSTVLRRRGPNGTILSNATAPTDLGGGSVYKDVDDRTTAVSGSTDRTSDSGRRYRDNDDARTEVTDSTYMTGITAGVSNIGAREERRKKKEARDRDRERRREEKARAKEDKKAARRGETTDGRRKVGADGALIDEEAEAEAKEHLRSYRHERAARVGGINKESDASTWDGSTNPSASTMSGGRSEATGSTVTENLLAGQQRTPESTPKKTGGGIRKVYSTADKVASREAERVRAEARRLQEKGRSHMAASSAAASSSAPPKRESSSKRDSSSGVPKRDFSFQRGGSDESRGLALRRIEPIQEAESSVSGSGYEEMRVPGSWGATSDVGTASEVGTKSYHHPIPELTGSSISGSGVATNDFAYQDDKRRQRKGGGSRR